MACYWKIVNLSEIIRPHVCLHSHFSSILQDVFYLLGKHVSFFLCQILTVFCHCVRGWEGRISCNSAMSCHFKQYLNEHKNNFQNVEYV